MRGPVVYILLVCAFEVSIEEEKFFRLTRFYNSQIQKYCGYTFAERKDEQERRVYRLQQNVKYRVAYLGQFPWAVLIWGWENGTIQTRCTGIYISRRHIIAPAHCLDFSRRGLRNYPVPETYKALAATTCARLPDDPNQEALCEFGVEAEVMRLKSFIITDRAIAENVLVQSGFPLPLRNDIVIFEVDDPIKRWDSKKHAICIRKPGEERPPNRTFIMAFGFTDKYSTDSVKLKWRELTSDELKQRKQRRRRRSLPRALDDSCTHDNEGFYMEEIEQVWYLSGMITRRTTCNSADPPENLDEFEVIPIDSLHDLICYHTGVCPLGIDTYIREPYMPTYFYWNYDGSQEYFRPKSLPWHFLKVLFQKYPPMPLMPPKPNNRQKDRQNHLIQREKEDIPGHPVRAETDHRHYRFAFDYVADPIFLAAAVDDRRHFIYPRLLPSGFMVLKKGAALSSRHFYPLSYIVYLYSLIIFLQFFGILNI